MECWVLLGCIVSNVAMIDFRWSELACSAMRTLYTRLAVLMVSIIDANRQSFCDL